MERLKKEIAAAADQSERKFAAQVGGQEPPAVPTAYMRQVRQKYLAAPIDQQFAYVKQVSGAQTSDQLIQAVDAYERYWEGK